MLIGSGQCRVAERSNEKKSRNEIADNTKSLALPDKTGFDKQIGPFTNINISQRGQC